MRYLLTIAYNGSKFNGFQRLKTNNSVQGKIEEALNIVFKEEIKLKGAGRTDSGVHACGQCCHFDINNTFNPNKLKYVLNNIVKPYIYIKECKIVSDAFHARFSVKRKCYTYKINMGEFDPLKEDYYLQVSKRLDLKNIKKASKLLLGKHNFKNFISGNRENYDAYIEKINFNIVDNILLINFYGPAFYRYMVRHLVGALIDIGEGKKSISDLKNAIDRSDIKQNFSVAKPSGLYLEKIWY